MTPEREMEIRARHALACVLASEGAGPPLDERERERRDLLASLDDERARANRCERERDELAAQLAALRDCASADGTTISGPCGVCVRCLRDGRASAHARAASVEAQLAALREAWMRYDRSCAMTALHDPDARVAWDRALAASAPAVEASTKRVQAEALESAAEAYSEEDDGEPRGTRQTCAWLRRRARELRGGR